MLVTLLTKATTLNPDLPVFSPDFKAKQHSETDAVSGAELASTNGQNGISTAPVNTTRPSPSQLMPPPPTHHAASSSANGNIDPDEKYTPEVHPPHYPRPGKGLMSILPPEEQDLQWLVEDDDKYGAFTHVYRADVPAAVAGASTNSNNDKNPDKMEE